ncbi:CST complex subunit CTC1 [Takifugu flavidus]|uniref:CST complex subunit CTC1 n=1 Tax=Takifugu flavidus TaxID=433684 RepID=A0A5C6MH64_9TELE|nr:CST complex subunit CTC1 [Takifugu flavidus]
MNCGPVHTRQMVNTPHDWWAVFTMTTVLLLWSYSRLVLDDGTGEAHVWVSGALVRPLLGLNDRQWEGLQRALRVRGQVEVYPWGQSLVCADALLHFLLCVCSSKVVCRQLALTCRRHNRQRSEGGVVAPPPPLVFSTKLLLLDTDDASAARPLIGCWLKRK